MKKIKYYINYNNAWGGQHSSDYTEKSMTKTEAEEYKKENPQHFVTDNILAMMYYCND